MTDLNLVEKIKNYASEAQKNGYDQLTVPLCDLFPVLMAAEESQLQGEDITLKKLALDITEHLFDTGSAEEEATTEALALATSKLKPLFVKLTKVQRNNEAFKSAANQNSEIGIKWQQRAESAEAELKRRDDAAPVAWRVLYAGERFYLFEKEHDAAKCHKKLDEFGWLDVRTEALYAAAHASLITSEERDLLRHTQDKLGKALARNSAMAGELERIATAVPMYLYREHNPNNGMKTCWHEISADSIEILKETVDPEAAEILTVYPHPPAEKSSGVEFSFPSRMTPGMMRAVQINSELGAYAAANLLGAYDMFQEFWAEAIKELISKDVKVVKLPNPNAPEYNMELQSLAFTVWFAELEKSLTAADVVYEVLP